MEDMTRRNYEHSRPLDVHRWSDHPEVNAFVNQIYEEYIHQSGTNTNIRKKHLKVVLLDLYVAWSDDPNLNIAVHMSMNAYSDGTVSSKGKSRYNALHIKVSTIDVVHLLHITGLIGLKEGWQDPDGKSYLTRIWAAEPLIQMFMDAAFGYFDVGYPENKATVILRDENKRNIEYEDTAETRRMHDLLLRYNRLLERSFIDIPSLDQPRIELGDKENRRRNNKPVFVNITHYGKFVRRIFNNGTFDDGGRFYGGWWQRIDGSYRKAIRMNNLPTVEIDYSSLHVILAYTEVGIDYWKMTDDYPYELPVRGVSNPDHCRAITKLLFLLGFNASDEKALFKAFRNELDYTAYPYSFPDDVLSELLNGIKDRHPKISRLICSGAGLRLMNIDAQMCKYVIEKFVERDTPILTVHDSFIVPFGTERQLDRVMKEAFEHVTYKTKVKAKYNSNLTEAQLYAGRAIDRDWYLDRLSVVTKPEMAKGYRLRMERHNQEFNQAADVGY
tara:strand:- start:1083 stop:2582 length:1500 start_codon:yes stop_codon:yes gene_type:complete